MTFLSSFGQTYMFGAYKGPIMASFDLSDTAFGSWYLLITLGSAAGLNLLGHYLDKLHLQRWTLLVLGATIAASVLLVLSPFFALTMISLIAYRLLGQGLMIHTATTSMSRYFSHSRGKAISIAMLGIPLGQTLLPFAATLSLDYMSWQQSLALLSAGFMLISLPLVLFLLRGHGDRHATWLADSAASEASYQRQQYQTATDPIEETETTQITLPRFENPVSWRRKQVLGDYRFYLLLPNLLSIPFWVTAIFFFAADIAAEKGFDMADLTALYGFNGLSAIIAPFMFGALVDKVGGRPLLVLAGPTLLLALVLCIMMDSLTVAALFYTVLGLSIGVSVPINNSVWTELYGTRYLGEIKSMAVSIIVVSTALSPWMIGLLLDSGISMTTILWGGVAHAALSVPLLLPIIRQKP